MARDRVIVTGGYMTATTSVRILDVKKGKVCIETGYGHQWMRPRDVLNLNILLRFPNVDSTIVAGEVSPLDDSGCS